MALLARNRPHRSGGALPCATMPACQSPASQSAQTCVHPASTQHKLFIHINVLDFVCAVTCPAALDLPQCARAPHISWRLASTKQHSSEAGPQRAALTSASRPKNNCPQDPVLPLAAPAALAE